MADNHDESKNFVKEFDKCPGCGSTEMFFKSILDELKERGLIEKNVKCFQFQLEEGIPLLQEKVNLLPIGSELPAFGRIWDTCCNCGMVHSTHLEVRTFKKSIDVAQMPKNRAERRQARAFNPNNFN